MKQRDLKYIENSILEKNKIIQSCLLVEKSKEKEIPKSILIEQLQALKGLTEAFSNSKNLVEYKVATVRNIERAIDEINTKEYYEGIEYLVLLNGIGLMDLWDRDAIVLRKQISISMYWTMLFTIISNLLTLWLN